MTDAKDSRVSADEYVVQTGPNAEETDIFDSMDLLKFTAMPLKPGSIKWKAGRVIGEGAFGRVLEGINTENGKQMAVKEMKIKDRSMPEAVQRAVRFHCILNVYLQVVRFENSQLKLNYWKR